MIKTGVDRITDHLNTFKNARLGLIINQASVDSHYIPTLQKFTDLDLNITALFGPQHGLFGHTQDNMVEWQGDEYSVKNGSVYSLYGHERKPSPEMLANIDMLVFDVPDVGTRYYTFIWTMALAMEAAMENGKKFVVLDRPNPLNGMDTEGPILDMKFRSFVGLYPLPARHGLTVGEIATWLQKKYFNDLSLQLIPIRGWQRSMFFDQCNLPWVMPSPNMPSLQTAIVYPGGCLLEATNISEGRGTTRPFEIFGAPWIDGYKMCDYLNQNCPGAYFQPWYFQPTFHKFSGELCQGAFINVTDRLKFRPLATTLTILSWLLEEYPDNFSFNDPPYEYEYDKLPIDILLGSDKWRQELMNGKKPVPYWTDLWREDQIQWRENRQEYLIYK